MAKRSFGTIEKLKSGNYRAFWKNGTTIIRAPSTFPHKKPAQEWLAAQQTAYASGQFDPTRPVVSEPEERRSLTLDQWVNEYLGRHAEAGTLAPKTIQSYRSCYRANLRDRFAKCPLSSITKEDVRSWYNGFDPTRPGARRSTYRVFSALMHAAVEEGLIPESPVAVKGAVTKKRRTIDNPRTIVATPKQVAALAAAMPDELAITVLLGFWCSMRYGEITELRRKDIDFGENDNTATIHVSRAVQYASGFGYMVGPPKTEAGIRDIAVPQAMIPALRNHLDTYVVQDRDALLVHSPTSITRWLSNKSLNGHFKKALRAVPDLAPRFTFHGLRHSGLTYAGQCGATLAELLRRAGHSDINTVLIYQHATRERDAALAERMSAGV